MYYLQNYYFRDMVTFLLANQYSQIRKYLTTMPVQTVLQQKCRVYGIKLPTTSVSQTVKVIVAVVVVVVLAVVFVVVVDAVVGMFLIFDIWTF